MPLADWWRRLLAYLLDGLVVGVPAILATIPVWPRLAAIFSEQIHAVQADPSTNTARFNAEYTDVFRSMTYYELPVVVLGVAYFVLMLRWRGATLGHMAAGLRVRLREAAGRLPWRAVLLRVLVLDGVRVLPVVFTAIGLGLVGTPLTWASSVFLLLNGLWPLWDDKRQALHDKIARTNVVKVR